MQPLEVINAAFERTGLKRRSRRVKKLERLVEWFLSTPDGLTAECGTWLGTSAYVLSSFGARLHCFDSFQGFADGTIKKYRIDVEQTRKNLDGLDVTLHQGWIPDVFQEAPEGPYRFVHLDVDQYEPTREAIEFFRPRLASGGMIVCDDYNSRWTEHAVKAVDEAGGFEVVDEQAIYAHH